MPDDTTATNKDLVARFLLLLVNDDAAGMRPLVADDVIWWVPASASTRFGLDRPLRGWDHIAWFGGGGWKGFKAGTSTLRIHHLIAEGDLVAAHYQRTAERRDGSAYDVEYHFMLRVAGGRIAEVWEVADTAAAFASAPPQP